MSGWYSSTIAVPRDKVAQATIALHEIGYDARLSDQSPRDEHPGFVVIATKRHLTGDDAGRRNLDDARAALDAADVPHHGYSHGGPPISGGTSAHRWLNVYTVHGRPLGLKVVAATDNEIDGQLLVIAEMLDIDRHLLTVDPPDLAVAALRETVPAGEPVSASDPEYSRARDGLEAAIVRYEDARRRNDAEAALALVAEVLTWAVALDDWHCRAYEAAHGKSPRYRDIRDELDKQGWIAAARWARNRSLHDLAPLLEVTPGAAWPVRWPVTWFEQRWRRRDELPAPKGGYRSDATGEAAYDRHAGEPVRYLVYAVRQLLRGEVWKLHAQAGTVEV